MLDQNFSAAMVNQRWASDITYLWTNQGWLYLSVVMDLIHHSDRGVQYMSDDFQDLLKKNGIAWKLCTGMTSRDVTETLELALQASGCDQVDVVQKPRLLSDNGSSRSSITTTTSGTMRA